MKTLKTLLKQKPIYTGGLWTTREELVTEFEAENLDESTNILFAFYSDTGYTGEAFVLFEKDGELFEVNGGHCSCYGLEGQWKPEPTTLEVLRHRLVNGRMGKDYYGQDLYSGELQSFLGIKVKKYDKRHNKENT